MRYAVTVWLLLPLALVGCKQQSKGPVTTTTEPPPQTALEPIPPAEPTPETTPPHAPVVTPPPSQYYEPSPPPAATPAPAVNTYTVQKGDTLWSISLRFLGDGKRWREIVEANPGLEPSKLRIGQVIILPPK